MLRISLLLVVLVRFQSVSAQTAYEHRPGSYDGIGKWYMGREIAHVMGYQGIDWLERPEREKEENIRQLIQNLSVQPGEVVADIGAGAGIHAIRIAEIQPRAKVYAIDIQPEMLEVIEQKSDQQGLANITTVRGFPTSVNLPSYSVDKVLMVDVYHEFEFPKEMMQSIHRSLRDNGLVFLIEFRMEDPRIPIKELHKMSKAQAVKEMNVIGFELIENKSNLPWQHCLIFKKR